MTSSAQGPAGNAGQAFHDTGFEGSSSPAGPHHVARRTASRVCAARPWGAWGKAFIAGACAVAAAGCAVRAGGGKPVAGPDRVTPATAEVSDDAFAAAVHDLLLSAPGSAERAVRLGAVEGRQMVRAAARFKAHTPDRGIAAVSGGLYLVRVGEPVQGMLGPSGGEALTAAAREFALRGDEGRARALYNLLLHVGPPAGRAEIETHLRALDAWTSASVGEAGPVAAAGALERIAVRRRLLEPSAAAVDDAAKVTSEWIGRAIELRDKFRKNRTQPAREEGAEAWRALETGPLVLASIYLQDGNVAGALAAIDHIQARDLLESERPQFATALEAAVREPNLGRCIDLLAQLRPLSSREATHGEEDFEDDRDLFGAAAFGVARECYRQDPSVPQVAFSVVVALDELGMAETTPAILTEAVRVHPEPAVVSEALALSLAAMASEEESGNVDAARRTFRAATPLLAVAGQPALAGKVQPSAARLRAAMGEIELREGHIEPARVLLKQSSDEERSGGVLLSLARIEWRDGQSRSALDHLHDALSAQDTQHDPALRGEVLLTVSDITRDSGDVAAARTPLTQALKDLVQSRNLPDADARARVERVLARVLDRFGAAQPAQRAIERAYAAAPGDKRQAAQTIELLIGRAFVRGDMAQARDGLQRAVVTDIENDDLVYFALWVRLLERQLHQPTDGVADRVFASTPDDGGWVAALARFGEGKLRGEDIIARATTPIQKYEALFYAAMDRRASGDTKGGDDLLRQVVAGTGLELSEVTLARDILDPARAQVGGPLPPDVSIP
jgi:tetratricopeptide (TPR) repeat protein